MLELKNDKQAKVSLDGLAQNIYDYSSDTLRKNLEVDGMEDEDAPIQEKDNEILKTIQKIVVRVKKEGNEVLKKEGVEGLKKYLNTATSQFHEMMMIYVGDANSSPLFKKRPEQQKAHIKAYRKLSMINFNEYVETKHSAKSTKLNELFESNELDIFFWAKALSQNTQEGWVPKFAVQVESNALKSLYLKMRTRFKSKNGFEYDFVEYAKKNMERGIFDRIKTAAEKSLIQNEDYDRFVKSNIPAITTKTIERCEKPLKSYFKILEENIGENK